MKQIILGTAILAMGIVSATTAGAEFTTRTTGQEPHSPFMRDYGRSLPPIGHVVFCSQFPTDCVQSGPKRVQVQLTAVKKEDLRTINTLVNRMVRPVSDMDLYGQLENWTYPNGAGDCEDYVLLKQRLLIDRGWPASALLITVLRDENDEGHAVLTVRTSSGDFLLDNRRADIRAWNEAPYTFIKRQSGSNPKNWVSLSRPDRTMDVKRTAGTSAN